MTTIDLDFGEAGRQTKYVIVKSSPDRQETAGDKSIGSDREKSEGRRVEEVDSQFGSFAVRQVEAG